jgi:CHAT domain-containing protein/tetratricopeptide (TPR) repeat protein
MAAQSIAELADKLDIEPEIGFQQFRQRFFDALEHRLLSDCEALLDVLCAASSPCWQNECRYHQAILFFELRQFDRGEALLRELLADNLTPFLRARTLLEMGSVLNEQGQWNEAEQLFHQAQAAYAAIDDVLGQAKAYNNLGIAIRFQIEQGAKPSKDLQDAADYHKAALHLLELVANDSEQTQWEIERNWHGLAMSYGQMGRYDAALDAFQTDISLCQELGDPPDLAVSLSDLAALVYQPLGQWDAAAEMLDQALAIFREHDDPLNMAVALTYQGKLLEGQGHIEAALVDYNDALDHVESIRARLTAPSVRTNYRAVVESIYAAPLSLYLRQGDAEQAFNLAERARSRTLADMLAGQSAWPHADIPANLLEQRHALHQQLDQLHADEAPPETRKNLEKTLADLDHQIELLDPTYAALDTVKPLTAMEVRRRLPSDAVLLTYASDIDDQLWILVVSPTGVDATLIPKLKVNWLQRYLFDHLDGVRRGSLVPRPRTGHLEPPRLFPELYKVLIEPVADILGKAQTIYIVPFGPLHYVPLGALTPNLSSPPPFLASGRRVVYAPSATVLLNYCHQRPPSSNSDILAIAPQDDRLSATDGAARTIAGLGNSRPITGTAATRQALLEQAGSYQMLCFLGHAKFDSKYPMLSRLLLVDGSLHAGEILRDLRLDADLVVLAACESGRSRVLRGDEILGLSRSLLYAGTPCLLVTLWEVHEISTRLLMENFFTRPQLDDAASIGFDPALALAQAQCWLRKLTCAEARTLMASWNEFSPAQIEAWLTTLWQVTHPGQPLQDDGQLFDHPFFWAPYILIGDRPMQPTAS